MDQHEPVKLAQPKRLHSKRDSQLQNSSPSVPRVEQPAVSMLTLFCQIITSIGYNHRWLLLFSLTDRRVRKISGKYVFFLLFSFSRPRFCLVATPTRGLILPNMPWSTTLFGWDSQELPFAHYLEPLLTLSINTQIADSIHSSTRRAPLHFVEGDNTKRYGFYPINCGFYPPLHSLSTAPFRRA